VGAAGAITPNDPTWSQSWAQRQVNMPLAWDITTGDPSAVIAIVDTGINPNTPDLQGLIAPGWDFTTNSSTSADTQGHGTAAATEAAGRGNDGQGVAGYCWRCRVMPIRVSQTGINFDSSLVAQGIRWAADNGARVISLSFSDNGTMAADPQIASAIAYAYSKNVFVAASAGNSGNSFPTHPASDPGAVAITATDPWDGLYSWSASGSWIHLAAPGCNVVIYPEYDGMECGVSTAAPAIAGIVGLMLSINPGLTVDQLVSALVSTSVAVPGINGGRVDAYKALVAVGGHLPVKPPPPPPPPPPPSAVKRLTPKPGPKVKTRIQHGTLRAQRVTRIKVLPGKVAATLRSPKAKSCTVTLSSNDALWVSAAVRAGPVSVSARVPAGRYKVNVSCRVHRPKPYALVLRANFA